MGVLMTCNENDRLLRKTGRVFNNKAPHGYIVFEAANTDKIKLFRKTDAGVLKVKMTADFFVLISRSICKEAC